MPFHARKVPVGGSPKPNEAGCRYPRFNGDREACKLLRGEACELCGASHALALPLVLDHDHHTGAFRGWLCNRCNTALGMWEDDPQRMRKAIIYLEKQPPPRCPYRAPRHHRR